ncbi:MAG: 2,3-bisphosphoglycerate-independent phosphoglycerate mutase [Candidatus Woesearchaeota archaeon]
MNPFVLVIRDGWGYAKPAKDNAITQANTPTEDMLEKSYPKCLLDASGKAVGLPAKTIGTSEIGHATMGSGRVIDTDLSRINKSIRKGEFDKNPVLTLMFQHVRQTKAKLHVMILLSDGGVHSHINHLYAMLKSAKKAKVPVIIHAFLDGRDVPPKSSKKYLNDLNRFIKRLNHEVKIGTLMGRYYGMDRDNRWQRTKKAYEALVFGKGTRSPLPEEELEAAYLKGITDEFVEPIVNTSVPRIGDKDAIVCLNFRRDRARQLTEAFTKRAFNGFPRPHWLNTYFVTMTEYSPKYTLPVLYPNPELKNTLGEVIAEQGWSQLRIAETEKYAHVTYFFNGLKDYLFAKEDCVLIPSPKVSTYEKSPGMSAKKITDAIIVDILAGKHQFYVINYANADMVGHTGDVKATIESVQIADACLGKVLEAIKKKEGIALITADHGNAEKMFDADIQQAHTAHTLNKVRCFIYSDIAKVKKLKMHDGSLADIAPTALKLLGLKKPREMTGTPLF